jgi:hypothetical protein
MMLTRISNLDGSDPFDLSALVASWSVSVDARINFLTPVGAAGALDVLGRARAPEAEARMDLELVIKGTDEAAVSAAAREAARALFGATWAQGLRKLYWREGAREMWSLARAVARPEAVHEPGYITHTRLRCQLVLPDPFAYWPLDPSWLTAHGYTPATLPASDVPEQIAPDLTFASFVITASPFTFTLRHVGDLETGRVLFLLYSNADGGMTNPRIENLTTGHSWQVILSGATRQTRLSVYAAPAMGRAQRTDDAGATWTDVTAQLVLGDLQAVLMELAPGDNVMHYLDAGVPNLTLYASWWHVYRIL